MSWNGSNSAGASTPAPKKPAKKSPGLTHGLIAGAAIVLIGIIALYFVTSENDEPTVEKKVPTQIAEVEADLRENSNTTETVKEQKPVKRPFWENPTTNGLNAAQIRKWKWEHRPVPSWTNTSARTDAKARFEIFDTYIENQIAALISLEPGESLVGMPEYGKNEEEAFLKSCETPIVVSADDDEYVKRLKEAMNQTKIDLRQRMNNGEDFSTIMRDAHGELQRLGQVRQQIQSMVRDELSKYTSEEDAVLLIDAANKMLEEKGLKQLSDSPIIRQNIRQMIRMNQMELQY